MAFRETGHYIKPTFTWDGINQTTVFVNLGRSDVEYASDPETRRSVSGGTVFLCDSVISVFSRMQKMCDTSGHRGETCRLCGVGPKQAVCVSSLGVDETQGEDSHGGLEERWTW
jgi:hypothetical protein